MNGTKVIYLPAVVRARIKQKGIKLGIYQIDWWDEKHASQVAGMESEVNYYFGCGNHEVYKHKKEQKLKEVHKKKLKFVEETRYIFDHD